MPTTPEQAASLARHIRDTDGFTTDERARLDAMTDAEIEHAARDDPDAQPANEAALEHAVAKRTIRQRSFGAFTEAIETSKNEGQFYVERRQQGDYAVRRGGSERASAVAPTQHDAIQRARQLDPGALIHVERQRKTDKGGREKWRKA